MTFNACDVSNGRLSGEHSSKHLASSLARSFEDLPLLFFAVQFGLQDIGANFTSSVSLQLVDELLLLSLVTVDQALESRNLQLHGFDID